MLVSLLAIYTEHNRRCRGRMEHHSSSLLVVIQYYSVIDRICLHAIRIHSNLLIYLGYDIRVTAVRIIVMLIIV